MKFNIDQDSIANDSSMTENEILTLTLQSKFGEDKVKFNRATGYYDIYAEKDVIAKSPDLKKWKFIVMDEDKKPFLKKMVPQEMLE
ncbi:hypothetical protein [Niabella ginsengisoli]|uniref:Uncharacterized protein n=1 Tax=Niabella ginsengisoli TaxID=522298 RepID=A0ABS9SM23_9BACT|nr:hypothetical protein [Niabella ginsengisoli]MCH5599422.1 hypothetical protein [Niabella ginsengisoli]